MFFGLKVGLEAIFDPFRSLVFVQGSHGSGSNNKTEIVEPYFVRRWAPKVNSNLKYIQNLVHLCTHNIRIGRS